MATLGSDTVLVVDDDASVRAALARLIALSGYDVETIGGAEELFDGDVLERVGCLVIDYQLPGLDGLELQALLNRRGSHRPIVFISGYADVPRSVQAMKAGAVDFLAKPVDESELIRAIREGCEQHARRQEVWTEVEELRRRYATLTPRERDVYALIVAGRMNKNAARELGIAEKTIKVHRARIMLKMRARTFAELVRYAMRIEIPDAASAADLALAQVSRVRDGPDAMRRLATRIAVARAPELA
jgi:FixJ family two-component response regulator